MQFIGTGDRILTENFNVGYLYTITFKTGIYINSACIGIGDTFVMFQKAEPDLLFTLNVDTAEEVDTIELYDSGGGTNNYDDLVNRPQINSHTLTGNMSGSDLGLQDTISDLDTIRAGAAAGATAVQPSALETALAQKQDALSSQQLDAVNSGITSADVEQITTNKNNILSIYNQNGKTFNIVDWSLINGTVGSDNNVTYSYVDGIVTVTGTKSVADSYMTVTDTLILIPNKNYVVSQIQSGSPDMRLKVFGYDTTWRQLADTGSSTTFNSGTYSKFMVRFTLAGSSTGVAVDKTIKPMLIDKSVYDAGYTDYQPYAMSNAELTAAIQAIQTQLANS